MIAAGLRSVRGPSARFSKFVIQRGTLEYELRKPKGTSNSMILVPLFDLKFLRRTRGTRCRNFKSAALGNVRNTKATDDCSPCGNAGLQRWCQAVKSSFAARSGAVTRQLVECSKS
jgi:hypothetical protein